jgi:hypothetical protein
MSAHAMTMAERVETVKLLSDGMAAGEVVVNIGILEGLADDLLLAPIGEIEAMRVSLSALAEATRNAPPPAPAAPLRTAADDAPDDDDLTPVGDVAVTKRRRRGDPS